jgi:hypothetical protein
MSKAPNQFAAANALHLIPEDDDGSWYGGGLKKHRQSFFARKKRSTPPPPPPEALRASVYQAPVCINSLGTDWTTTSSAHFGHSVRPPEQPGVNWLRVATIGFGGLALVGAAYVGLAVDGASRAQAAQALPVASLVARAEQVRSIPLPPKPPSTALATGPLSAERESAADGVDDRSPASIAAAEGVDTASVLRTSVAFTESAPGKQPAAKLTRRTGKGAPAADSGKAEPASQSARSKGKRRGRTAVAAVSGASAATETSEASSSDAEAVDESSNEVSQTSAAPAEQLSAQPTRQQVMSGLEALRPALNACVAGAHGTSFANVTIAGSGRVTYSTIEGAFAGTNQGSCMARALRSASFPRFASDSFNVRYPFAF